MSSIVTVGHTHQPTGDKLEFLEKQGYVVQEDEEQHCWWVWSPREAEFKGASFESESAAIEAAWTAAVGHTTGILNMPREQWDALSFEQQKELIAAGN